MILGFCHRKFFGLAFLLSCSLGLHAQITINGNQTANNLAQLLVGQGVTISNPTLVCPQAANGDFYVVPPNVSNLGLDSGIILTSGTAQTTATAQGANGPALGPSTSHITAGDPDLTVLSGQSSTNDACILEFDFVPLGDTIKFDYVFGSSEYPTFTCTQFNDVFGFFISGPGINGPFANNAENLALVPGSTTCPVGVSTIYCPNMPGCCNTTNFCFANTPGCGAFNAANNTCAYFVCNAGGASVNYQGFTTVLQAITPVQACSTYHLKLAIADAVDQSLDSGVFLKAGSLTSNAVVFTPLSNLNNPYPYIVEGCLPGLIKVSRPVATPQAVTIPYQIGGVAINGTDYSNLPGTVTIPANDTVAYIVVNAIADALVEGPEDVKIYQLAPCTGGIIDSVELIIHDKIQAFITQSDTAICKEDSVFLSVQGDDSLSYSWTPITNINNPNIKEPTVSPNVTTSYIMAASLPNSNCPPVFDTVEITINQEPEVLLGNDTIICKDIQIQFNPGISPVQNYTYTWSGSGTPFLSNTNTANPLGTFNVVGNYQLILQVDPAALGCEGSDTINIEVIPNDITLHNGDTTVCEGADVQLNVTGHPYFTYTWTPSTYLNSATIEDPLSNPDTAINYTVTANFPGCIPMTKSVNIEVEPVPIVDAGMNREVCKFDTLNLHGTVDPSSYPFYTWNWSPANAFINNSVPNPVFIGTDPANIQLIVSTPIGCSDTDIVFLTVHPVEFATISPEQSLLCPNESIQYNAAGGVSYLWTPSLFLDFDNIADPISTPKAPIEYTIYSTSIHSCIDTDKVEIKIAPGAVVDAGDDVTLYPGERHIMKTTGNCSLFDWFPPYALSSTTVSNPEASPLVTTRYYVNASTEAGCKTIDSIDIRVSDESIIDLPNVFSPGSGTSINDRLKIVKRGIVELDEFKIFNRWGELVYSSKDIEEGWDGRFQGVSQPLGVYVYRIQATTSTGKRFYKQGNVTLVR